MASFRFFKLSDSFLTIIIEYYLLHYTQKKSVLQANEVAAIEYKIIVNGIEEIILAILKKEYSEGGRTYGT